jgi:site-specific recombinase XerD
MKPPKISIVYNRLNYKSKSGAAPIYLRLYQFGKTDYIILDDLSIQQSEWKGDQANEEWTSDYLINGIISKHLARIRSFIREQQFKGELVTIKRIKTFFLNPISSDMTFNQYIDNYIRTVNKRRKIKIAHGTIKGYKSFLKKFNSFNDHIQFKQFTPEFAFEYLTYLEQECNLKGSTQQKHIDKLKVVYGCASDDGHFEYNHRFFKKLEINVQPPQRISLQENEIIHLRDTRIKDEDLDFYRQIFLFQCLSGLYYSDLKRLTVGGFQEYKSNDQTHWSIKGNRGKGNRGKKGNVFVVALNETSYKLLCKLSNLKTGQSQDLLFSGLIADQKYNEKLKIIGSKLKLEKSLCNKVGRHTYGELMVSIGNSREKVGGTMGHTKDETTKIYSEMSAASVLKGLILPDI